MYSESNHNKIERKPSEISRLRRSFLKKFNPVYRNQKQDDQTVPKGIYIRNVSKRAKSPFRKYELAAIEASVRSPIDKKRSVSASDLTLVGNGDRRVLADKEFKNKDYKPINNLEDLVIACVEAPPLKKSHQNNKNMIYYKKKYLFNLEGSNWNLFSSEVLNEKLINAKERQKSASHSDLYHATKDLNYEIENSKQKTLDAESEAKKSFNSKKAKDPAPRLPRLSSKSKGVAPRISSKPTSKDSRPSKSVNSDSKKSGMSKQYARVIKLEPLNHNVVQGSNKPVKDTTELDDCKNFYFGDDTDSNKSKSSTLELEKKPLVSEKETDLAEHFMKSLIEESKVLRQKIADGDDDLATFERLTKILTLKKKYDQYKAKQAGKSFPRTEKKATETLATRKVSLSKSDTKLEKKLSSKENKQERKNSLREKQKFEALPFTKMVLMKKQMRKEESKPMFGNTEFLSDLKFHPLVKLP